MKGVSWIPVFAVVTADFAVLVQSTFLDEQKKLAIQELLTNRAFLRIHTMFIKNQLISIRPQPAANDPSAGRTE